MQFENKSFSSGGKMGDASTVYHDGKKCIMWPQLPEIFFANRPPLQ